MKEALADPLRWRASRLVFVNSMSDLFHEKVPEAFIRSVFEVMVEAPQHRFQVLTKRAERLQALAPRLPWPDNVWMGVSVESDRYTSRVDALRTTPARDARGGLGADVRGEDPKQQYQHDHRFPA